MFTLRRSSSSSDDLVALIGEPNNNELNVNDIIVHNANSSANLIDFNIDNIPAPFNTTNTPNNSNANAAYNNNPKNFKNKANAINNINNNNVSTIFINNTDPSHMFNYVNPTGSTYNSNNSNSTLSNNINTPSIPIHAVNINDIISFRATNVLNSTNDEENRDIVCGCMIFPCTRQLTRFATLKWFLIFIVVCLMAQGSAQVYFNKTAKLWKDEFGFSEEMADWLIVCNALFHGVFTIFIIHASLRFHRMVWISASLTLLAVTCFALLIPEIVHPLNYTHGSTIKHHFESMQICSIAANITEELDFPNIHDSCWICYVMMILFQASLGSSTSSLFIYGAIYIDDHESVENAIFYNGVFLGFKEMGSYIGNFLTWISVLTQGTNIFATPEWAGLVAIFLIIGLILGMYPKFLSENIRIKSAVCSADALYNTKDLKAFIGRIIRNKVVLLNICSAVFFWSAVNNFSLVENKYNQAKFAYPDLSLFNATLNFEIVIAVLKPFIIFFTILLTSTMIVKYNLRAFHLALWNGIVPAFLVCVFLVYIFLGCDSPDLNDGKDTLRNDCNQNCDCERSLFEPVCVVELQRTYFSPCYAGCTGVSYDRGDLTYLNCTCSSTTHIPFSAYPGLCTMSHCYPEWLSRDLLQLLVSTLTGTALVSHTVVSLYCVHFSERCYALAVQMTAVGFFGFGPIRGVYNALCKAACRYLSPSGSCRLHDPVPLTRYILTLTIFLLLLSSLCGLLMAVNIRRQIAYTPDLIGNVVPRRKRRYQTVSFVKQSPVDLANLEEGAKIVEDDKEEYGNDTTPLVFAEMHAASVIPSMKTILEEEMEFLEQEEPMKNIEMELMELDDIDLDYTEATPFIPKPAL